MASATQTRPQPQIIPPGEEEERELEIDTGAALASLNKSELETQIEFALKRPRSLEQFRKRVESMSCMNEAIALQMNYVLPRGEGITGPSVRFAEVVACSWGNNMAMSRVVGADDQWVRAQGLFYDCETNYRYGREVSRRITDKNGKRFNADMIGVTGNAAASIAYRNSVLYGIPKGMWYDLYLKSREAAVGNVETVAKQRGEILEWLKQAGVPMANVFNTLGIQGPHDIGADQMLALKVMQREIKSGERSIEAVFGTAESADIEAAMTHLGWNEGQKVSSRVAFRGRPGEHLAYLREEITKREKAGVSSAPPAKQQQQEIAPKPSSNAANAAEMPREGKATVGGGSDVAASDGATEEAPAKQQEAPPKRAPAASAKTMKW